MNILKIVLIIALQISASVSLAHVGLKSTMPEQGAILGASPAAIELEFSGVVRLIKLDVRNTKGDKVDVNFQPSVQADRNFHIKLPEFSNGKFTVNWLVMGGDAHKMSGKFDFTVHNEKSKDTVLSASTNNSNTMTDQELRAQVHVHDDAHH